MDLHTYVQTWHALTNQVCPVANLLTFDHPHHVIQELLWAQVRHAPYRVAAQSLPWLTYINFSKFMSGQNHI